MIETQRLLLRPYGLDDFGHYWAMLCEPVARFPSRLQISQEEAWRRLMATAGHWSLFGYGIFAVIEKSTGEYVGEAGLMNMRRELGDRFAGCDEAGWYLRARARGRGLGFEATQAAHGWFERNFGQRRTFCIVDRPNTPSVNLAFKLGYEVLDLHTCEEHELLFFERTSQETRTERLYEVPSSLQPLHGSIQAKAAALRSSW